MLPRWTKCYIDERCVEHNGQWGLYVCNNCGKTFWARMCAKKKVKNVFCNTKCKKDFQVKKDLPPVSKEQYNKAYSEYYDLVKQCAFQTLDEKYMYLLEDCMQMGFMELYRLCYKINLDCNKKYVRKAVKHAMSDYYRNWARQQEKYIDISNYTKNNEIDESFLNDKIFAKSNIENYDNKVYLNKVLKDKKYLYLFICSYCPELTVSQKQELSNKLTKYKSYRKALQALRLNLRRDYPEIREYLQN